jgi:hypothetical protein
MTHIHCPHLDRLGQELIEAYRRVDDRDVFCSTTDTGAPNEVAALHHVMAEHRKSCPRCLEIARTIESSPMELI